MRTPYLILILASMALGSARRAPSANSRHKLLISGCLRMAVVRKHFDCEAGDSHFCCSLLQNQTSEGPSSDNSRARTAESSSSVATTTSTTTAPTTITIKAAPSTKQRRVTFRPRQSSTPLPFMAEEFQAPDHSASSPLDPVFSPPVRDQLDLERPEEAEASQSFSLEEQQQQQQRRPSDADESESAPAADLQRDYQTNYDQDAALYDESYFQDDYYYYYYEEGAVSEESNMIQSTDDTILGTSHRDLYEDYEPAYDYELYYSYDTHNELDESESAIRFQDSYENPWFRDQSTTATRSIQPSTTTTPPRVTTVSPDETTKVFLGGHRRAMLLDQLDSEKKNASEEAFAAEDPFDLLYDIEDIIDRDACAMLKVPCRFVSDHPCCKYRPPSRDVGGRARGMDGSADLKWRRPVSYMVGTPREAQGRSLGLIVDPESFIQHGDANGDENNAEDHIVYTHAHSKMSVRTPRYHLSRRPEDVRALLGQCWRLHYVHCATMQSHPCCQLVSNPKPMDPSENVLTRWLGGSLNYYGEQSKQESKIESEAIHSSTHKAS